MQNQIINTYLASSLELSKLRTRTKDDLYEQEEILRDLDIHLELAAKGSEERKSLTDYRIFILDTSRELKDLLQVINQILPKQTEGRTTKDRYDVAVRNINPINRSYTPRHITLGEVIQWSLSQQSQSHA